MKIIIEVLGYFSVLLVMITGIYRIIKTHVACGL